MIEHNLPHQVTSFIGRDAEIADCVSSLQDPSCRLLTLTGPGGVGKTRLAVEVAARSTLSSYFVPLQPLTHTEHILTTVINVVLPQLNNSSDPQAQFINYLINNPLLLILDNFEHLSEGVDLVKKMVDASLHVKLLVTSREPLRLQAEWQREVKGLAYPDGRNSDQELSSVQLFVERARSVKAEFSLEAERETVYRICSLAKGMPLTVEIAARWVKYQSCSRILHDLLNLENRLHDVPQRHRSMRAVFNHSWQLMLEDERQVFQQLSVFRGGFTTEAATKITKATYELLAALVDKSMLQQLPEDRFTVHELLRQFGHEHLIDSGSDQATHQAHSGYYASWLNRLVDDLKGRRQIPALREVEADFENIRVAWTWAADHQQIDLLQQMVDGITIYSRIHSRRGQGYELFRYAENRINPSNDATTERLYGKLLARTLGYTYESKAVYLEPALEIAGRYDDRAEIAFCLSQIADWALRHGYDDEGKETLIESLAMYREVGDQYALGRVLFGMAFVTSYTGTWDENIRYGEESLSISRAIGDQIGATWALLSVAIKAGRLGQFDEAEALWKEWSRMGEETDNPYLVAAGHSHMAHKVYFFQGKFSKSRASAETTIQIYRQINDTVGVGVGLATLGLLAVMSEDYNDADRLARESVSISDFALIVRFAAWVSSLAACGQGDYTAADHHLGKAFHLVDNMLGLPGILSCLPIRATILAHNGDRTRAVELLALAFTHLPEAAAWMKKWPHLDRLMAELQFDLGMDVYADFWQRGSRIDIAIVTTELREMYLIDKQLSQPLVDPLTNRELEILRLVAEGHSNPHIADSLILSLGTIKWYTSQIYSKLGVKNRTQAVRRAQELGFFP